MEIQPLVSVWGLAVAIGTEDPLRAVDADRHGAARDLVVASPVAIEALEVEPPHVEVDPLVREVHGAVHVAVLHRVAAPALEMALPTGRAVGRPTLRATETRSTSGVG